MRKRMLRIGLSFFVFLIPIAGIYFGTQVLYDNHHALGLLVGIVSAFIMLPLSGILLDAITNDRALYFNINKPWEFHLDKSKKD